MKPPLGTLHGISKWSQSLGVAADPQVSLEGLLLVEIVCINATAQGSYIYTVKQ